MVRWVGRALPAGTFLGPCCWLVIAALRTAWYCGTLGRTNERERTMSSVEHHALGSYTEDWLAKALSDRAGYELGCGPDGELTSSPHCAAIVFEYAYDDSFSSAPS